MAPCADLELKWDRLIRASWSLYGVQCGVRRGNTVGHTQQCNRQLLVSPR